MSAIRKFEIAAYRAFARDASLHERSVGLSIVSNAIDEYLGKIQPSDLARLDEWQNARACRAIAYLKLLKRDINLLASKCRQEATRTETQASQHCAGNGAAQKLTEVKNA